MIKGRSLACPCRACGSCRFYLLLYCLLRCQLVFFDRDPLISAHACKELLFCDVALLDQNISTSKLVQEFFHQDILFIWQLKEDHDILDEDQFASSLVCQGAEHYLQVLLTVLNF